MRAFIPLEKTVAPPSQDTEGVLPPPLSLPPPESGFETEGFSDPGDGVCGSEMGEFPSSEAIVFTVKLELIVQAEQYKSRLELTTK